MKIRNVFPDFLIALVGFVRGYFHNKASQDYLYGFELGVLNRYIHEFQSPIMIDHGEITIEEARNHARKNA